MTLVSFVIILWALSTAAPLHLFGNTWTIPGYLVWAALIYSIIGTVFAHFIGRPLIALMFQLQRYEADFRFNLVRVRENAEQIALLSGADAERERLEARFENVATNWFDIMSRTKKLTSFTAGFEQISIIFPYLVVSPAFFAGEVQLGALMQTASAFNSVQGALSFFVSSYSEIAEWRAIIERLAGFQRSVATAKAAITAPPAIDMTAGGNTAIALRGVDVRLPQGVPIVAAERFDVALRDRILVNGPSGSGKSTLFRAIAGIWPFGEGSIAVPAGARVMMLPQQPYLPIGTLRAAVSYPAAPDHFGADIVAETLTAVGLPALAPRLDDNAHWGHILSPGEQQRVALARAILHQPDFLFLDEATASLDEAAEAALYRLLLARLPTPPSSRSATARRCRPGTTATSISIEQGDRYVVTDVTGR